MHKGSLALGYTKVAKAYNSTSGEVIGSTQKCIEESRTHRVKRTLEKIKHEESQSAR